MISNRLSRWTPLFFVCAVVNFLIAQLVMLSGVSYPEQSWFATGTLVAVHLLTIGWLLLLVLGALLQFVPVITNQVLPRQGLALAALICLQLGLVAMLGGFVGLGLGITMLVHCLPVGGGLVIIGVLIAVGDILVPLCRCRPLPLPGRMVRTAMVFLLLAVTLGLLLALALSLPGSRRWLSPLLAHGVGYHALAGLGGWFTLAAMGVSYKLFPMFMLAPEERGALGEWVHYASVAGFAIAIVAGLSRCWYPVPALRALELLGYAVVAVAIILYLVDMARIYRSRKRALIELQNRAALGAFVMLGLATIIAVASLLTGSLAANLPLLIFLVLFGWLGGLGLTQLYKIVPFLTWLARFGKQLGRGRVPRVQDLVDEPYATPWFVIYFAGVLLAIPAFSGFSTSLYKIAGTLIFLSSLMLALEYWRAWRGHYVDGQVDKQEEKPKGGSRSSPP